MRRGHDGRPPDGRREVAVPVEVKETPTDETPRATRVVVEVMVGGEDHHPAPLMETGPERVGEGVGSLDEEGGDQ